MALELTNKPLGGLYTITGSAESINGNRVFTARDLSNREVWLCCLSDQDLAACSPLIGASQHPNVLPIVDTIDDQGMRAVVLPKLEEDVPCGITPDLEVLYRYLIQVCDAIIWLRNQGVVLHNLNYTSIVSVGGRPVLRDYFARMPVTDGELGNAEPTGCDESRMVYAVSSWALRSFPSMREREPELHGVLSIGSAFLTADRWSTIDELLSQVSIAFMARKVRKLSPRSVISAVGAYCLIILVGLRELSFQLLQEF